jgi:hypothetical protein
LSEIRTFCGTFCFFWGEFQDFQDFQDFFQDFQDFIDFFSAWMRIGPVLSSSVGKMELTLGPKLMERRETSRYGKGREAEGKREDKEVEGTKREGG